MAFLDENGLSHLWEIIIQKLSKKVDKVDGKGLSTNDFTNLEKNHVAVGYNNAHWHTNLSALNGITSAKITAWDGKQDALVSGTNIKTINGETILGSGNISIQGGGGGGSLAACSANNTTSGTVATSNDPQTVVTLNRFNVRTDANAFSFSGGGIKCEKAGVVQINASIYLRVGSSSAATGTSGCYVRKNGTEIASNYSYTNNAYNTKGCTKIIEVAAGDVITLCSRTSAAGLCYPGNVATYLEVVYLS